MTGAKVGNHCNGDSHFTFDPVMTGHASVDASGAGTGNNSCNQNGSGTGGSGKLGVTALLNLESGTIMIDPTMTGSSHFTGGPMVTGGHNQFSLQNMDPRDYPILDALQNLHHSGSIDFGANMSGSSAFTGGAMVTGGHNGFSQLMM